jgi:hypothetical protein
MCRLSLWPAGSGTHRFIVVHIVMSTAATGGVITIVTDSIAFRVNVGTAASLIRSISTGALLAHSLSLPKAALVAAFVFLVAAQTLMSLIAALFLVRLSTKEPVHERERRFDAVGCGELGGQGCETCRLSTA